MPVPANLSVIAEFQDNRGFRAITRINGFTPDLSVTGPNGLINMGLESLVAILSTPSTGIFAALQACSNAKIVRQGFQIDLNYAQEPSSETGTYQLVQDKARLEFGDGRGGFNSVSIPAPKDGLFLTTADNNLIVVDPTASLLTALQTALAQTVSQSAFSANPVGPLLLSPRGGQVGAQFFGGQYEGKKSRVRRVLQGQ